MVVGRRALRVEPRAQVRVARDLFDCRRNACAGAGKIPWTNRDPEVRPLFHHDPMDAARLKSARAVAAMGLARGSGAAHTTFAQRTFR